MIIIVEGVDNSGKTILANKLAKKLKAILIKTENIPPEATALYQYAGILQAAEAYGNGIVVSDRHAAISDPIYGPICRGWTKLLLGECANEIDRVDAIVYCRPSDELILSNLSERDQMAGVVTNVKALIDAYDQFFGQLELKNGKVWRYDWSKDDVNILAQEIQRYARLP